MANILIVEDNIMNMEMAGELLESAGHFTIRTETASEGIKLAEIKKPDLILMDLSLSGMDGLTATRILKEDFLTKNIPVIAFTARVMQSDKEKAFGAGCNGFISKPIEVSSFVKSVESFLNYKDISVTQKNVDSSLLIKPASEKPAKKENFGSKYNRHNVLIIDDNPMNTEILKETLEQIGQSSVIAYSGQEALETAKKEKFDLILLDIMMPGMSGFDVIKAFKSNPRTQDIPVIFVSALDQTADIVKGFDLGSYEYITKPFKIEELKARILSILKIKDLQDQLKAEKTLLDLIFKFSADGIVILNRVFEIISCNDLFLNWLNLPKEKVINHDFCDVSGYDKDFCTIKQAFKKGESYRDFCIEINKEKRFIEINCSEINHGSGDIEGYILILRDVTTNKEIERQKETFTATLTHDLKTPVRAQIRALELFLDGKFGEINNTQKEIIEETLNSNKYMFSMVDNLLETYKYENKSVNLQKHYFDVNNLIKDCYNRIKYLANDKNQTVNFDFEAETLDLYADSLEINRVVMNLFSNAINYTGENGQILIKSRLKNDSVEISFIDNGKGISPEEIAELFNKYKSFSKKFKQVGTGLGLYLSKRIVENHDGTISAESEEGKGSIFTVKLPVN